MPLFDVMKLSAIQSELIDAVPAIKLITPQSVNVYVPLFGRNHAMINGVLLII